MHNFQPGTSDLPHLYYTILPSITGRSFEPYHVETVRGSYFRSLPSVLSYLGL